MVGASSVRVSSWLRCKSSTAIGGAPSAATVSSSLTHHGPLSKRHLRHRCQHQGCPRPCLLRPIYLPDSPLQGTDAARAPRKKQKTNRPWLPGAPRQNMVLQPATSLCSTQAPRAFPQAEQASRSGSGPHRAASSNETFCCCRPRIRFCCRLSC